VRNQTVRSRSARRGGRSPTSIPRSTSCRASFVQVRGYISPVTPGPRAARAGRPGRRPTAMGTGHDHRRPALPSATGSGHFQGHGYPATGGGGQAAGAAGGRESGGGGGAGQGEETGAGGGDGDGERGTGGGAVETGRHVPGPSVTLPTGAPATGGGLSGMVRLSGTVWAPHHRPRPQPRPRPQLRSGSQRRPRPQPRPGLATPSGGAAAPGHQAHLGRSAAWAGNPSLDHRRERPSLVRTWMRRTRPWPHSVARRSSSLPWR
jgi:hypothetical protein